MKSPPVYDSYLAAMLESRREINMTQQRLAQLTGIRQSRISDIENKKVDPKFSEVLGIAEVLDRSLLIVPNRFLPYAEAAIRDCQRSEDRKTKSPTIAEQILGDILDY